MFSIRPNSSLNWLFFRSFATIYNDRLQYKILSAVSFGCHIVKNSHVMQMNVEFFDEKIYNER